MSYVGRGVGLMGDTVDCIFKGRKCVRCGYRLPRTIKKTPKRRCQAGLGDRVETVLERFGITESRYKEAKRLFGLMPECNCQKRKKWLNKVGRYFEIKE